MYREIENVSKYHGIVFRSYRPALIHTLATRESILSGLIPHIILQT